MEVEHDGVKYTLPVDADVQCIQRDFSLPSQNRLVDDYVIKDGKIHPLAIIVPGGGYFWVASGLEGTPISKRLNSNI